MDFRNGYPIGYVSKSHGFKGHVKINFFEEKYKQLIVEKGFLFLEISKKGVPFCIEEVDRKKSVVLLEGVKDEAKAKSISGLQIVAFDLKGLDEGTDSLVGFKLFDQKEKLIGEIVEINDFNSNVLFEVKVKEENLLIPFHENLLIDLDADNRKIIMQIPEGLIEE